MVEYLPAWLTDELNKLLAELPTRKHRQTVLRLAEAAAIGRTEIETFKLPGVCSRTTWQGRYREDGPRPGWKDDPQMQAALEAATQRAQWWQDQAEARRIAKRQEQVAEARDLLTEYAPHAAKRLFVLMGTAGNEETRRKAANDILDRADEATASKAVVMEKGDHEQRVRFDVGELPPEVLRLLADAGGEEGAGEGSEGGTE